MTSQTGAAGRRVERIHTLSPLQQGLLFHSMLGSGADSYLEQVSCRLDGPLDSTAFREAWTRVMARHGILRTSIHWTDQAQARQVVHRKVALPWTEHDWRRLPAAEQEGRLEALAHEDWIRGFDLARPPLMRLTLVRLADDVHQLVWSNHHLILDGWSRAQVYQEVLTYYRAALSGRPVSLPTAPDTGDYLAWLRAQDAAEAESFWRTELAGIEAATPLPAASPAADATGAGREVADLSLPQEVGTVLRETGRRHGLTMSTLVHAAWALLLGRYSGESDVLFGSTVAGRPYDLPGAERMVGLFINTLPVRLGLPRGTSTVAWLRDCQDRMAAVGQYAYSALSDIQGWSGIPRGAPLFENIVVVENFPLRAQDTSPDDGPVLGDVQARVQTHYPLTLVAAPGDRLELRLAYDVARYDATVAERLLTQLGRLLAGIAADPEGPVDALRMLTAEDEELLAALADGGPAARPEYRPLPALIAERLASRPDAVAVVAGERHMTNGALLAEAGRLAHLLRSRGTGPEGPVAVNLERSADLVVVLLAIWLAGAPYLPIDPDYPAERLAYLLADSGARTLITRRGLVPAGLPDEALLCLDDPRVAAELAGQPVAPPAVCGPAPQSPAYLVYTSGSTGRPKGVTVTHAGLSNLVAWQEDEFGLGPDDRVSQAIGPAFDPYGLEVWPALSAGARLHVLDEAERVRPDLLPAWLHEQGCTVAILPVALAEQALAADWPQGSALRHMVSGGDRLHARPAPGLPFRLVNNYGPTEATVVGTWCTVTPAPASSGLPPIGRPIAGVRAHVLDGLQRPVPQGAVGELFLGGAGVARGYHGRPGQTAASFVPDPFSPVPGARLYRTGDRVRLLPDGQLEFLGRGDRQVSVRGHRIEPAEIEAVLLSHEEVRAAAVVVRPDASGGRSLIAFAVPVPGSRPAGLREYCGAHMPRHQVPAAVVLLDELPLTPNGKLDEARLPAADDGARRAAPSTPTEELIAGVWEKILGIREPGVHEDFFALGGHSLLAAQIHNRVCSIFRVELPLRTLFSASTIAGLAREVDARRAVARSEPRPLVAGPRPEVLPLSSAQKRVWFFEEFEPGNPLYSISNAARLVGRLDVAALAASVTAVVARHETLRTTFVTVDGEPRQVVASPKPVPLPVVDLRGVDENRRDGVLRELAAAEAALPFDLARGPMLRLVLVSLSAPEHVLLLTFHHIVADGWSMGVLLDELTAGYSAALQDSDESGPRRQELPDLSVQYADYALWQRDALNEAGLRQHLDYWHEKLRGIPPLLALPTDRPRPQTLRYEGAAHAFTVPEPVSRAVDALARRLGATPFMVLLAAFQVVLARYSGSDDIVVGTPVANRPLPETEPMIGLFANTLALRTDLSGDPDFARLVGRVRDVCLEAYTHQEAPFEQLVEELSPTRDLSYSPLVQVMCNYQRVDETVRRWPGLEVSPWESAPGRGKTKFDLTMNLNEAPGVLSGSLEYNTDLFEPATIARMTRHFLTVLGTLAARPDTRLSALSMLGADEQRQILQEWSRTPAPGAPVLDLVQLIADQAARTPDAVALVLGACQLTYAALLARVDRLARRLRARGVGPDVAVGVALERSPETVLSMLAVMRAGGAYVPLDPGYPVDRLAFMVRDSGLRLVLTRGELAARLPLDCVPVLLLDDRHEAADGAATDPTPPGCTALDRLAYLIYTSGSTGTPKGAMVSHRGIAAFALALRGALELGSRSRVLQFASTSFDASILEMVAALTSGGCLVVADAEHRMPGPGLIELLNEQAVTATLLPPSVLAALPGSELPALRTLAVGGEACPQEVVDRWAPGRRLVNLYGPTEATVWSTFTECHAGEPVTIGRPIAGTRVYVLDRRMRPVPAGVPGELYLGGGGLARGYLGRPGLSADRFVPDPFGPAPGARLYRTGDLVRFLPGGLLAYLGRTDEQVKVRGFRIEPGEIETVLNRHPAIQESVVTARREASGGARLVAHVVPREQVGEAELRDFCARKLPNHMVPAAFVLLDALPTTPSGKVDRNRLPAPTASAGAPSTDTDDGGDATPRTPAEQTLVAIWAEVLGVERIALDQNFFALGGDSILSIQVVSKATRAGLPVTPKLLFEHPTVAELAEAVTASAGPDGPGTPRTQTAGGAERAAAAIGPIRPTPVQRWFLDRDAAVPHHFNQSLMLRLRRPVPPSVLKGALQELVGHHDALRLRVLPGTDGPALEVAGRQVPPDSLLTTVDLGALPVTEQSAALARLTDRVQAGLDLSAGCLIRALYVRLGTRLGDRLLLVAHHLAVDSVSWRILADDLALALRSAADGREISLPAKTASFREWSEQLAQRARSDELDRQIPYWVDTLTSGATALPGRPVVDGDTAADTYADAASEEIVLGERETRALIRSGGQAADATIQEMLLTALGRALSAWTGAPRVTVDVEGHGRGDGDLDVSRTVGWFTAIHPLLLDTGGDARTALARVRQRLRDAPDRGHGYGLLRYHRSDAATERLRSLAVPDVVFNYLGHVVDAPAGSETPWDAAPESAGDNQPADEQRPYRLAVGAIVSGGRLRLRLDYNVRLHTSAEMRRLAGLLREEVAAVTEAREAADTYPLSPLQEGMLFHCAEEPGSGVYIVQLACRLSGDLDPELLRTAWAELVDHHDVLRTSFLFDGLERPLQVAHRRVPPSWTELDWRDRTDAEQRSALEALRREIRFNRFDLSSAPLINLTLVRVEDDAWHMVWTHHHILLDGWSMPLLTKELFDRYQAARDQRFFVPPPSPPFREYVAWVERQDPAEAEEFWRGALRGRSGPTPLPAGDPARTEGGPSCAQEEIRLSEAETERVYQLARGLGLTPSTLVNAAWALLLGMHSGDEDLVFGVTVANRPPELPGVENMIGLLINTVPLRVHAGADQTVGAWLRDLHARSLDVQRYCHHSLLRIADWSGMPRGRSLFESIVVFENYPPGEAAGGVPAGLRIEDVQGVEQTSYPLTLGSAPGPQMPLTLLYDTGRYRAQDCLRLLGQLRGLLAGMAADPDRPLRELPLADEPEPRPLLDGPTPSRATEDTAPEDLHTLVERQAGRAPDRVAVVWGERQLGYGALNARANRLARLLRRHGVGPETRVGLLLDRSPDLVVAVLAVLKAGGAYVPVDPDHPADRRALILADAGIRVLLSDTADGHEAAPPGAVSLALNELTQELAAQSADDLSDAVDQGCLAYLIYTSGSTGRPKGVGITRAALARGVAAWREAAGLGAADRTLQTASAAFDVFTEDLARALGSAGTLVLCPRSLLLEPAGLLARMDEQRITAAEFVPVVLRHLTGEARRAGRVLDALRLLVSGADALPMRDLERARTLGGPGLRLVNSYGVTEATVDNTWYVDLAAREERTDDALTPIGRPLRHTRAYVLDHRGRLLPDGVAGELYLGGAAVGRGYFERPGLTAGRFLPDPFGPPGSRLYRTGDRVRRRDDGNLEFLGRLDDQIKLRGLRIEPGEVEAALTAHPDVSAAAVVVVPDRAEAESRLVAFVVAPPPTEADSGRDTLTAELRAGAAQRLPAALVPTAFVRLDALPVSPNGKVDRAALAALPVPLPGAERDADDEKPKTPAERALAAIWADVLGVERVGVHDNFFVLGGDSIVSLQVVTRARTAGWLVQTKQVFRHQTLGELAAVAVEADDAALTGTVQRAEQGVVTGQFPATPIQAEFLAERTGAPEHANQAVLLRARGPVDPTALNAALTALTRHHDALRLRLPRTANGPSPDDGMTGLIEQAGLDGIPDRLLQVVNLATLPEKDRSAELERMAARAQTALDLTAGCLLGAWYFDLGPDIPGRLLLIGHHLAVDGVSWRILLEDLHEAYRQALADGPDVQVALPAKTTAFRDWARHLHERAQSEEVGAEADHWVSTVQAGAQTAVPLDLLPREDESLGDVNTRADADSVRVSLDGERTAALLRDVPRAYGARVDEVLLTAATLALTEATGEPGVLVELEGHGREQVPDGMDISRTVGWFTSVHPVHLEITRGVSPARALQQVRERLAAVPGQGLGYGLLRHLRSEDPATRKLAELPTASIVFNYLGRLDSSFRPGGLWEPAPEDPGPARDPHAVRLHLLEINAFVLGGELTFTWIYSRRLNHRRTVVDLAERCLETLRGLADEAREVSAASPPGTLSARQLAKLNERFGD
ncbi:amino acid adenylation domain-containing protein [Streptomyces sp. NPDC002078]